MFGDKWLTCTNRIQNLDGTRFRDFSVIAHDAWHEFGDRAIPYFEGAGRLLNYNSIITDRVARWIYYSGAYFCAKKKALLEVPLDESRCWGQGEDVFFSRLVYFKYGAEGFNFNNHSFVKFLKQKEKAPWEFLPEIHE